LIDVRPDDLAGLVIRGVLDQIPELDRSTIDDVMLGCGLTHHEQGYNIGRNAALLAGLPDTVPGTTVNRFCASSLQTIRMAFHAIKAGEGEVFVAAGVESVSRTMEKGIDAEDFNPRFMDEHRDDFINHVYIPMGITAENVAERFGVDRARMDEYAKLSQDRAVAAQADGFFQREIIPVALEDGTIVGSDDGPRPGTTLEKLASLPPAFKPGGTVTAGNSCPLNDGAAAVVVMSQERAEALGIVPLARIVASSVSALAPEIMGVGPIEAVGRVLSQTGMKIGDVDIVELNEAFAAQVLPVVDEVGIDVAGQLNPHGGAIALGHPFGMTGARIMTTLLNGLQTADRTVGLETMCVGGGQGMAMIVERLN
jgi:acetyl-CoA C-acetyltransferase